MPCVGGIRKEALEDLAQRLVRPASKPERRCLRDTRGGGFDRGAEALRPAGPLGDGPANTTCSSGRRRATAPTRPARSSSQPRSSGPADRRRPRAPRRCPAGARARSSRADRGSPAMLPGSARACARRRPRGGPRRGGTRRARRASSAGWLGASSRAGRRHRAVETPTWSARARSAATSRWARISARVSGGVPAGAEIAPRRRQRSPGLPSSATEVVAEPASMASSARGTFVTGNRYRLAWAAPTARRSACDRSPRRRHG
jgi:hypothetical protein